MNIIADTEEIGPIAGLSLTAVIREFDDLDRQAAAQAADEHSLLARVVVQVLAAESRSDVQDMMLRSIANELGAARRMHGRTMLRRMHEAWVLVHQFPATHEALRAGDIAPAHADIVCAAGVDLDDETRATFETVALDRARRESPNRLKSILDSVSEEFRTTSINERHQRARAERHVRVSDVGDGMSQLTALLPSVLAHGIHDALTNTAHSVTKAHRRARKNLSLLEAQVVTGEGTIANLSDLAQLRIAATDDRTFDQIRADALCDLLLASTPMTHGCAEDRIEAHVQISIPFLTLIDESDTSATLAGVGPIDADTARRLAGGAAQWDRVLTHPVTGQVVAVDSYRPSNHQRRTLRARDEHCRFAGCMQPVWRGDIDHARDWAHGGETANDNLSHLCRSHHTMKHAMGWRIRHLEDGIIEFTSPSGNTYTDVPTSTLRFIDSDELPDRAAVPRSHRDFARWNKPSVEPPPF